MTSGASYDAALRRLSSAARFGIHPSLDGIRAICIALGNPQSAFRAIQVAGTNGKTSTARMLTSILAAHGLSVGLFTSPALGERTEQISIDRALTREAFASAIEAAGEAAERVGIEATEFELMTAAALWAFREARVDVAVLEVGMGGRWDATSVVVPQVAVVTSVDVDHAEHLGSTREAIADEKAQIIKGGSRAVLGQGVAGVLEIFMLRAEDVGAPLTVVTPAPAAGDVVFEVSCASDDVRGATDLAVVTPRGFYDRLTLLAPAFQASNAAVAIAASEVALGRTLEPERVSDALLATSFPARFEVLAEEPIIVADGAHNPAAAAVLAQAVRRSFGDEQPTIVLGVLDDKDAEGIVQELATVAGGFVATASTSERSLAPEALARVITEVTGGSPEIVHGVAAAVEYARERGNVVVTGSLTVAAEARSELVD